MRYVYNKCENQIELRNWPPLLQFPVIGEKVMPFYSKFGK